MKNFNNNQKLIVISLITFVIIFLLYHLKFSSYAQCVDGYVKSREWIYRNLTDPKNIIENIRSQGKVECKINPNKF